MRAILIALAMVGGWSGAAVATPYTQEETWIATWPTWPHSGVQVLKWLHYEPYSLTCEHAVQTVTVPSASANGTVAITVHRC